MSRQAPSKSGRARLRATLRLARRTALRAKGRSALIAAMVAIPVMGLTGVAVVGMSMVPTLQEKIAVELGEMQAWVRVVNAPDPTLEQSPTEPTWWEVERDRRYNPTLPSEVADYVSVLDVLPRGTEVVGMRDTSVTATTATGQAGIRATEGEAWHPSFTGRFDLIDGRSPRNAGEIAVTEAALQRFGVALGDEVELVSPAKNVRVVGVIDDARLPDTESHIYAKWGALVPDDGTAFGTDGTYYLPELELEWADVEQINESGIIAWSRSVQLDPPPAGTYRLSYDNPLQGLAVTVLTLTGVIGGFAVFEVALLAGAAFAVGARRDQRMLATVASVGGTRRTLFQVVSFGGVVLGAIGGLVGIGLGIAGATMFMQATHDGSAVQYWGYHVNWPIVAGIAIFALAIGWLAALVPAAIASRVDVVAALRGARRPPRASTKRPVFGAMIVVAGVGVAVLGAVLNGIAMDVASIIRHPTLRMMGTALLFAGPVLAQLGLILAAPLMLRSTARLFSRLGLGARLGTRDAARNTGRAVPALAAITSTVFVASLLMVFISSGETMSRQSYQYSTMPGQVEVEIGEYVEDHPGLAADVAAALEESFDVSIVRTLESAPDSPDWRDPSPTRLMAVPQVDPGKVCPTHPDSPDYDPAYVPGTPEAARVEHSDPRCTKMSFYIGTQGWADKIWVGDERDLALILDEPLTSADERTLWAGGVVSLYAEYVHADGKVHLEWWSEKQLVDGDASDAARNPFRELALPAVLHEPQVPILFGMFMLEETAHELGLETRPSLVLAALVSPPNDADHDAMLASLDALLTPDSMGSDTLFARVEQGPSAFAGPSLWGLLGASALITLAASAVAIGLARVDGRRDDATLHAVGGSIRVRRSFSFWQTLVIAGLGSIAGATLGLVPVWAMSLAGGHGTMPFVAPWLHLGLVVVVLPIAIAIGSWVTATGTRQLQRAVID